MSERVSAIQRLRGLPEVFTLHDVRMLGLGIGSERVAVDRWKRAGMCAPVGPKVGMFYNLIRDPEGPQRRLGEALKALFGPVVIVGPVALNDQHWTNQLPGVLTVAVPPRLSYPQVHAAALYPRSPEWYASIRTPAMRNERGRFGLPMLPPEFALADMLRHRDCLHGLQPDDIDIPEDASADALTGAFGALGVAPDEYEPYLRQSELQIPFQFR